LSSTNKDLQLSAATLPPLWLLIGIAALGPIVMNGVLPANTALMAEFSIRYGTAQLILTVFLVATFFGQIILGSYADRYGRRPVMCFSLAGFALGGFLCAIASSMEWLLAARFVQGFFAATCTFLPRAIVRDVFGRDKAASMIGYMTVAMMVAPMFGPALGGWITDNFSWRVMYVGLGVAGAIAAGFSFLFLNETKADNLNSPKSIALHVASRDLLRSREFVSNALMLAGAIGLYYAFLAGAPFVMMESRGYSASEYGRWFAMVAIGYLSGNLVAGRFSERLGTARMIKLGILPGVFGVFLLWLLSFWDSPLGLFVPIMCVAFSNGMSLPNLMSSIMSVRTDLISSASGLSGAIQTAFGVLLTYTLGVLLPASDLWLNIIWTFSTAVWMFGYWIKPGNIKPE